MGNTSSRVRRSVILDDPSQVLQLRLSQPVLDQRPPSNIHSVVLSIHLLSVDLPELSNSQSKEINRVPVHDIVDDLASVLGRQITLAHFFSQRAAQHKTQG